MPKCAATRVSICAAVSAGSRAEVRACTFDSNALVALSTRPSGMTFTCAMALYTGRPSTYCWKNWCDTPLWRVT